MKVITYFKPDEKDLHKDGKIWNIEPNDKGHYLKVSIDNKFWSIEKWNEDKVLYRYARTMDKVFTVTVDYTTQERILNDYENDSKKKIEILCP